MRRHKDPTKCPKQKTTQAQQTEDPQAEDTPSPEDNPSRRQLKHRRPPQPRQSPQPPQARGRCTRYGALHPLRSGAPVTWRCTRYVAVHPNRRGALPTVRVQCPNTQEQTRNWHTEPLTAAPLHAQLGPTGGRMGTPPTPPPALRPTPTHSDTSYTLTCEEPGKTRNERGPATSREALRTAGCGPGFGQRALAYRSTECPDAAEVRMASTTRRLSRASSMVTCSAPTPRIASRKRSCSRARGSRLVRA